MWKRAAVPRKADRYREAEQGGEVALQRQGVGVLGPIGVGRCRGFACAAGRRLGILDQALGLTHVQPAVYHLVGEVFGVVAADQGAGMARGTSEEHRVGDECVSTCRIWCRTSPKKKNNNI